MLRERRDRSEQDVTSLARNLVREFVFFKELATETPDEAKYVEKIARDHLSMVRTFEQKNLIQEG